MEPAGVGPLAGPPPTITRIHTERLVPMSGIQNTGWAALLSSSSTTSSSSTDGSTSLRGFADLTEKQRTEIRALLKTTQTDDLTAAELEQQIQAIINGTSPSSTGSSTSRSSSSSTSDGTSSSTSDDSSTSSSSSATSDPFTNLDLTDSQKSQIQSILENAQTQGLSPSDVLTQIDAVLTTSQQSTLQSDLQSLQALGAPPPPPPPPPSSSSGLTDDQKSQIETILQNAESAGTDTSTLAAQIEAVLDGTSSSSTSTVQNAQSSNSGLQSAGGGSSSSSSTSATLSNGLTAADIQRQALAALSIIEHSLADQYSSS